MWLTLKAPPQVLRRRAWTGRVTSGHIQTTKEKDRLHLLSDKGFDQWWLSVHPTAARAPERGCRSQGAVKLGVEKPVRSLARVV